MFVSSDFQQDEFNANVNNITLNNTSHLHANLGFTLVYTASQ